MHVYKINMDVYANIGRYAQKYFPSSTNKESPEAMTPQYQRADLGF